MAEIAQFRFNGFVVDPTSRLLFHNGKTVATTSRVFETLLVLLKNRGKVVSKDALMAQIWPDAVVEESNLVQNIYTLRKILGEKPDEHKFIVTVPGRGYSFVAPVVEIEGVPRCTRLARVPKMVWVGVALAAAAAVLAAMYTQRRMPGALHPVPVTSFPGAEMWPTFSPDGGRLAFMWNGENGDNWDIYIRLLGTGSVSRLTTHPGVDASPAWSPDGRFVAFLRCAGEESGFYVVPALGGVEQKVAGTRCSDMPGRRLDWLHGSQSRLSQTWMVLNGGSPYSAWTSLPEPGRNCLRRRLIPGATDSPPCRPTGG